MRTVITLVLAAIGVPIWLIVGVLGGAVWSRRRFKAQAGVFELAVRPAGTAKWPRSLGYARCVHDVLVINIGLALLRTRIYAVREVRDIEIGTTPKGIDDAVFRVVLLDDGDSLEVAVAAADAGELDALARS